MPSSISSRSTCTSNPFHALANNIVPAVVLFSIVLGCALVGVDHRERLLDVLFVARAAIARATRLVTRLTPYGLFAIAANAAGTLDIQQLERLQIYLVAYVVVALLVSLWVLPGLVAALTPLRARDILRESHAVTAHRRDCRRPVHRAARIDGSQPRGCSIASSRVTTNPGG